jgi:hypothetical protein
LAAEIEGWRRAPPTLGMSHPNEDPIPHAARMRAIGDLLARGVRRLQELKGHDIRRRGGDEEILAVDPATCLDLQAESSVTVGHAAMPRMKETR